MNNSRLVYSHEFGGRIWPPLDETYLERRVREERNMRRAFLKLRPFLALDFVITPIGKIEASRVCYDSKGRARAVRWIPEERFNLLRSRGFGIERLTFDQFAEAFFGGRR